MNVASTQRRALLIALLALFSFVWGTAGAETSGADVPVVRVVIDFGDGVEKHFVRLAWHEKMTVWEATRAADEHPRGIEVQHRGKGDTLFVTQIDDVKNEGGAGRNWIFRVNDEPGSRSAAISPVAADDTIVWRFDKYR